MAKEMVIIFVYDTQLVQKEEDDPATAILYFHPTFVSDQQKTALCGQLMGTIHCLRNVFSTPKIISLQSGKFFIIENGRYLLAIGTDRNITDWLLEHRAKTLYSLVNFFHKDFLALAELYQSSENLSAKLYHLFETYVKMLFFGGNLFSYVPSIALPKSASNVFTESIHILQCCQDFNYVLGGSMLYHNKVVATQLSPDLTKRLVLTDPYRIKCPAESAEATFDLPLGVQLLQVYISNKEYSKLVETSTRNRSIFQYLNNKSIKKMNSKNAAITDPIISTMKRDQSLIFTTVPEEDSDHSISTSTEQTFIPTAKKMRPKFLNLKSISIDSTIETKPFAKPTVMTPLCGQTSVCSTPMTELKKFVHQNPMSICLNETEVDTNDNTPESVKACKVSDDKSVKILDTVPYVTVNNNVCSIKKSTSYSTINSNGDVKNKSKIEDESPSKNKELKTFKTITDPTFPVFKTDGTIVSRPFYNDYIAYNIEAVKSEITNDKETIKQNNINKEIDPFKNFDACLNNNVNSQKNADIKMQINNQVSNKTSQEHRKSLTLPLKSLSMDGNDVSSPLNNRRYSSGVQLTPLMSKLSMLAFEERSSGFCSQTTTPGDFRGLTPTQSNFTFPYNKFKVPKAETKKKDDDDSFQKCILFVCGQQDVVLTLLMQEEICDAKDTINKLWELCTEQLGKLEKQLHYCLESQPGGAAHESEPYSYLCLDSEWDTVERGGPWGTSELANLTHLHRDFNEVSNITEILVRGCDSVIYGYHCGHTEVFYHEAAATNAGLPTPADPMGLVQLKAKRRLERDHAIILL